MVFDKDFSTTTTKKSGFSDCLLDVTKIKDGAFKLSHKSQNSSEHLYKTSGVDIHKGDALVDWLVETQGAKRRAATRLGEQIDGIGSFAGMFRPNFKGMQDPILVSGTDGVGTKLLLALKANALEGVGIDLVAMCVNDLYCLGASPLFFIDYYATGVLNTTQFKRVLTGIKTGLKSCDTVLLGGETAELPGLYAKGHFDLGGFIVGVVDYKKRLGSHLVKSGDRLIALGSSGFHSNGYSLIRHWLKQKPANKSLLKKILEPTRIYYQIPKLLALSTTKNFHALAHITGGGISGNLPRVIPANLCCAIQKNNLPTPSWMKDFLRAHGKSVLAMESIFNIGIGMIAVVGKSHAPRFLQLAKKSGLNAQDIGFVRPKQKKNPEVEFV